MSEASNTRSHDGVPVDGWKRTIDPGFTRSFNELPDGTFVWLTIQDPSVPDVSMTGGEEMSRRLNVTIVRVLYSPEFHVVVVPERVAR